jgi:hypothetical protein
LNRELIRINYKFETPKILEPSGEGNQSFARIDEDEDEKE